MKRWPLLALCLLGIPAAWPLSQLPFFTSDDGLFHLYRLAALDEAFRQGVLYPRLFPSFAYGYGQAVLAYYGPLAYYAAEGPRLLGASYPDALKWTFALGYVLSGCALFLLARQFVGSLPALLGAAVYVYFPYHIAETYQRGALAEHLAFVFLPLILWGIMPVEPSKNPARPGTLRLLVFALSAAALILMHSLTALIFLPFVLPYAAVSARAALQGGLPRRVGYHVLLALAAGFGLSAFYWLPILTESRWVGLSAGLDNAGYLEHLAPIQSFVQPALVFQYAPHQLVAADHPLGLLSGLLLLIALPVALYAWLQHDRLWRPLAFFAGLTVAALFMTTDLSGGIWRTLHNPLSFLQYPWRFMTLAALGLAMCAAIVFQRRPGLALAALPVVVLHGLLGLQPVATAAPSADSHAMWANDFMTRQIGATWTAEYVPWWVRADRTAIPLSLHTPLSESATSNLPTFSLLEANYTHSRYRVTPAESVRAGKVPARMPASLDAGTLGAGMDTGLLRFHQFYLPQWHATLAGKPLVTFPDTELGLLSVEIPTNVSAGGDELELNFGMSDMERFAALLSLAVGAAAAWLWRGWWLAPAALLVLGLSVFSLAASASHAQAEAILPSHATVSDLAELLAVRVDAHPYHAGDTLLVTLTWIVRSETREDFKSFVQLLDTGGTRAIAQSDGDPAGGFTPTSQWRSGEIVEETRELLIPPDTGPGTLRLIAGLYRLQPLQNLPAARGAETLPDGRIPLAEIQVVNR
jgi:hypothetical protein